MIKSTTINPFEGLLNLANLTKEDFDDFLIKNKDLTAKQSANLSAVKFVENSINITANNNNSILQNVSDVVNCTSYCDGEMRHIFEDYKGYHGYVTLVVSHVATCNGSLLQTSIQNI